MSAFGTQSSTSSPQSLERPLLQAFLPPSMALPSRFHPPRSKAVSKLRNWWKEGLVIKADELAQLCHADLALIIRKNGRYYTYCSIDHNQWPPPMTEIVCASRVEIARTLTEFRKNRTLCQSICFLKTLTTAIMIANQNRRKSHRKQYLSWRVQKHRRRRRPGVNLCCTTLANFQEHTRPGSAEGINTQASSLGQRDLV